MSYNVKATLETKDTVRARIARATGADQPSAFDVVKRENFLSDADFLDAVALEKLRRQDPAFIEARKAAANEWEALQEKAGQEAQKAAFESYKKSVVINEFEMADIERKARGKADSDLRLGKITSSKYAKKTMDYIESGKQEVVNTKANNMMFNAMIRGQI